MRSASGALKPGGVIVEGTAGNTGIGLSLVANARGYRTVIVMPQTQSIEKIEMLRLCGAEVRLVPARPYRDPGNYVRVSERLAAELAGTDPRGRDLGQPVGQPGELARPLRDDGTGDLAADRRADRRLHLRDRHRRDPGGHRQGTEGAQRGRHPDRRLADP